ncbi:MAG: hypothetical protein KAR39_00740 [Thermoplasmata archaeon]|nr:hypothetical protein [Thermoplasmata archaeon]
MNLEEYLEALESEEEPTDLKPGEESEWLEFTELNVPSGRFVIFDPLVGDEPYDGLVINVPEGCYRLLIKLLMTDEGWIFSRLRIFLPSEEPSLGKVLGETWTDVAMTGVCDHQALSPYIGNANMWERIQDEIYKVYPLGTINIDPTSQATMPVINSGHGDGTFPVYELISDSVRVGAEVEFATPE